jgi:hypothetical protein
MAPTPLQKTPQIPPIFKAATGTLHVSREKDGKLHLVDAGWDNTKGRSTGRLRASSPGGGRADPTPGRGSDDPPSKTRPPSVMRNGPL